MRGIYQSLHPREKHTTALRSLRGQAGGCPRQVSWACDKGTHRFSPVPQLILPGFLLTNVGIGASGNRTDSTLSGALASHALASRVQPLLWTQLVSGV